jgi:hypothetical protein
MPALTGKVAVVTGASRGIGRALALGLAREGCAVVVAAKSTESTEKLPGSVYTVAQEVEALGAAALAVPVDVRDAEQIDALAARTRERFGRIDVLVNNAGALWWQPLLDTPAKRFDLVMGVNARAAFLCCRAVLPAMIEQCWGHIINTSSANGSAKCWSFPFATFERAVVSLLSEVDPRDVLGQEEGPDEALALSGELAQVEGSIALIGQEMDEHGESPMLFRRLREKEARKAELAGLLAEARQRAANPLSEAWGEARSLLAALDSAPDPQDARLRLRGALRRIVSDIWLLVVPRGLDRLCAVQVWFAGGERHRDYLILHRPPNGLTGKEGGWWARSLAEVAEPGDLDLRNRKHAAELEAALESLDPAALEDA